MVQIGGATAAARACQLTTVCVHAAPSMMESATLCKVCLQDCTALFPLWQLALPLFSAPFFYLHSQLCMSYELIICSPSFSHLPRPFEHRRPLLITTIISPPRLVDRATSQHSKTINIIIKIQGYTLHVSDRWFAASRDRRERAWLCPSIRHDHFLRDR